ncbi:uncharacterized protein LOC134256191, partial [Saccostrea cucullata]|uniref:uncharacterized protein LOC134256191 n=1 Tax=Saccostrea cuccullata TaxID=36930 RepID=UPI002ED4A819
SGNRLSGNRLSSKSSLRTAILLGSVYGATRWKRRASYRSKGSLPEVCYNDRYDKNAWGNVSYVGRFLCPTDDSMGDDHTYCCGDVGQQYCCTFWDDGGRVAGVVIGIIVVAGIIFIGCYCCIKRRKHSQGSVVRSPPKTNYQPADYQDQSVPLRSPYNHDNGPMSSYPMTKPPYPGQENGPPPSGAPPPYDSATAGQGNLPYDPNPTGNLPYPVNPPPFQYQDGEKPPMSSNGSLPYPLHPPSAPSAPPYGEAPYPTGNAPYPPAGNMPYPPNNTPYPNQ